MARMCTVQACKGLCKPSAKTGVEHAEATPGNLGAYVRRETQGEWEHFFLATYRNDLKAVKAFAGEQYQIAVTYPDDEQVELLSDPYDFQHNVQAVSLLSLFAGR